MPRARTGALATALGLWTLFSFAACGSDGGSASQSNSRPPSEAGSGSATDVTDAGSFDVAIVDASQGLDASGGEVDTGAGGEAAPAPACTRTADVGSDDYCAYYDAGVFYVCAQGAPWPANQTCGITCSQGGACPIPDASLGVNQGGVCCANGVYYIPGASTSPTDTSACCKGG
jgi:hypothetical protein